MWFLVEWCDYDLLVDVYLELVTEYASVVIILPRLAGGSGDAFVGFVGLVGLRCKLDCFCFEFGLEGGLTTLEESKRGVFFVGVTAPSSVTL